MELLVLLIFFHLILDINSQYQKPILSVVYDDQTDDIRLTCEIPESVTADISCNLYTGENPQPYLKVQRYEKKTSRRLFCIFTAQRNDVFNVLQSVKSSEVSCDYSLISDSTVRSLMSDKYNLMPFFPTPTQTSTTETSTAGLFPTPTQTSTTETSTGLFPTQTQTSTTETSTGLFPTQTQTCTTATSTGLFPTQTQTPTTTVSLLTALSVTGICVLLAGLMSVCVFMCVRKKKSERRDLNPSHGDQGVLMSELKMKKSDSEAAGIYSEIISVPSPSLPLDLSGDIIVDSQETATDESHTYSSIPNIQLNTRDTDAVYSLVNKH